MYKVLIIDDDDAVRKTFKAFLEDSGYIVLEAANGRKGLEVFYKEKPDIVFTDLRMPEMDGVEVIKNLKADSPSTPVIIFSGTGNMHFPDEVINMGVYCTLTKPIFDMNELITIINKAVKK